ncbi:MAG: PaaI family thioesterase [Hyphomonas sp.]
MTSKLSTEDANTFIDRKFGDNVSNARLISMEKSKAVMRYTAKPFDLREDGYFSAPALMTLADSIAYFAILTETGRIEKLKTTNLNISFVEPCMGPVAIAEGRLVKLGTSLATIETRVRSENEEEAACRAIVTYSLPRDIGESQA